MSVLRLGYLLLTTFRRASLHFMNPSVPLKLKVLALAAVAFVISPLNLLGDIPLLGILDDVVLFGFVLNLFIRASDRALVPKAGNDLMLPVA
jgi:uncharacterized membrane protein YkvA (DUF1232 family)